MVFLQTNGPKRHQLTGPKKVQKTHSEHGGPRFREEGIFPQEKGRAERTFDAEVAVQPLLVNSLHVQRTFIFFVHFFFQVLKTGKN